MDCRCFSPEACSPEAHRRVFAGFRSFLTVMALLAVVVFSGCENPYIVHNLIRPVTLTAIEFRGDREETPYSLKPVFNKAVTEYTVVVHEFTEKVYPNAVPETGSSVTFENGWYM
ncbi:MAG: hypothetical protein LBH35_04340, partial [Treponema sp.]|nr:hypothetical protein [Treponema sp.]